jgi:superfamily II DNA or RNA helicase
MLFEQTARVLDEEGIVHGKRAAGHDTALLRNVQLIMTQTEASRVYKQESRALHDAKVVLVDELHQHQGPVFQRIMQDHVDAGAVIVGLTATPLDIDGFDELLIAGTVSEGRDCGALVKAETFAPDEPDLRHIRQYQVGEDLSEADNHKAIMRPGVFGRVQAAWLKHNPEQRPTILFAPDVAGSIFFAEQFWKAGIRSAHIDGEDTWIDGEFHSTDQDMRDHIAALSSRGEVKVVCNRFVLREGINWPWIECGIFATVFGGLTSYIQSGGRLLRACNATGKTKAIVLDHGGSWHRHGSLNEDRNWVLGLTNRQAVGERAEKLREHKEPEPITCPQCSKVRLSGRACPFCGFEAHKKSRVVVQVDGTLKQVEGDVYKPRRVKLEKDTEALWKGIYFSQKRCGRTFRAAEAWFFQKYHYWPPRDLPFMPKNGSDWWRKIKDVPAAELIGGAA